MTTECQANADCALGVCDTSSGSGTCQLLNIGGGKYHVMFERVILIQPQLVPAMRIVPLALVTLRLGLEPASYLPLEAVSIRNTVSEKQC